MRYTCICISTRNTQSSYPRGWLCHSIFAPLVALRSVSFHEVNALSSYKRIIHASTSLTIVIQSTMEGLGAAANVITVIELSAKIVSLCLEYSSAVKSAKSDIQRLIDELYTLKITLEGARQLLESPDGGRLRTSQRLRDGLSGCETQLRELERQLKDTLNVGRQQKAMNRLGFRALKWPFESKNVNDVIAIFERQRNTLSTALTIDQTYVIICYLV